jgi:hypothetical protein
VAAFERRPRRVHRRSASRGRSGSCPFRAGRPAAGSRAARPPHVERAGELVDWLIGQPRWVDTLAVRQRDRIRGPSASACLPAVSRQPRYRRLRAGCGSLASRAYRGPNGRPSGAEHRAAAALALGTGRRGTAADVAARLNLPLRTASRLLREAARAGLIASASPAAWRDPAHWLPHDGVLAIFQSDGAPDERSSARRDGRPTVRPRASCVSTSKGTLTRSARFGATGQP